MSQRRIFGCFTIVFFLLLIVAAILGGGGYYYFFFIHSNNIYTPSKPRPKLNLIPVQLPEYPPEAKVDKQQFFKELPKDEIVIPAKSHHVESDNRYKTYLFLKAYLECYAKRKGWDKKYDGVPTFVDMLAQRMAWKNKGAPSLDELYQQAENLRKQGCKDPVVELARAHALRLNNDKPEALEILKSAYPEIIYDRECPRIVRFLFLRELKFARQTLKLDKTKEGKEVKNRLNGLLVAAVASDDFRNCDLDIAMKLISSTGLSYIYGNVHHKMLTDNRRPFWFKKLLAGLYEVRKAWKMRGGGWASSVTEEGWKGFSIQLKLAYNELQEAWKARPDIPDIATEMLWITNCGGAAPGDTKLLWFNRAMLAQMDYNVAYNTLLFSRRPRWCGSHQQMLEVGQAALKTGRFDTWAPYFYIKCLMDIAEEMQVGNYRLLFRNPQVRKDLIELFDGYDKAKPFSEDMMLRIKATEAVCMTHAGKYARAKKAFDIIGKKSNYGKWIPCRKTDLVSLPDWEVLSGEAEIAITPDGKLLETAEMHFMKGDTKTACAMFEKLMEKYKDNKKIMRGLLQLYTEYQLIPDTPVEDYKYRTNPMKLAIRKKGFKLFDKLCKYGMDINTTDSEGNTVLLMAAWENNFDLLKLFLSKNADANQTNNLKQTPLMGAAKFQDGINSAKLLLAKGAKINAADKNGDTALSFAARDSKSPKMINFLLKNGADPNLANQDAVAPLMLAAQFMESPEAVEALAKAGANLNAEDKNKQNALMYAILRKEQDINIFKKLLELGADVKNCRENEDGYSLMHMVAEKWKNAEPAKLLIKAGAPIEVLDKGKETPLHLALRKNNISVAKVLMENVKDINKRGYVTLTPLDYAIGHTTPNVVQLVIDHGADVNKCDGDGWSPVYRAALLNRIDMAKVLLANKSKINIKDRKGRTALDIAKWPKMKAFLKANGAKSGKDL